MAKGKILNNGVWIEIDATNADKLGGQLPSYYAVKGTQNATSIGDWNNVITNGLYDGQNMANACPSETNHTWRYCVVHNHSANGTNWVTQTMWDFAGGAKYERQKIGNGSGGTWSPWRKILDQRDYDTLFNSVSNGKAQVATAITGKGGTVSGTAPHTFQQLADGVNSIPVGDYSIGETISATKIGVVAVVEKTYPARGANTYMVTETDWRTCSGYYTSRYTISANDVTSVAWTWEPGTTYSSVKMCLGANGTAYLGMTSGFAKALNATGGHVASATIGGTSWDLTALAYSSYDNTVIYGNTNGYIYKRDSALSAIWQYISSGLNSQINSIVVDNFGGIYYSDLAGNIVKLGPNGGFVWKNSTLGNTVLRVSANGELYALQNGGSILYRLFPDSGNVFWSVNLNSDSSSSNSQFMAGIDSTDGYIYAIGRNDGLKKVNPSSGAMDSTVTRISQSDGFNGTTQGFYNGNLYLWNGNSAIIKCKVRVTLK